MADVHLKYLASAKQDHELAVTVEVISQGAASIEFAQQAWRGETLLTQGRIRVGCVDATSLRPRRLPIEVAEAMWAG